MAKSKGRKKSPKAAAQRRAQQMPPARQIEETQNWRKKAVSALALISALVGIVLFFDWCHDQYQRTFPVIAVKSEGADSQHHALFVVKNNSSYLWMTNVKLICGIDFAMFQTDASGPIGFSFPVTSDKMNAPIAPNEAVEYECDPTHYMTIKDGKINLLGLTTEQPIPNLTKASLSAAQVWVGVNYRTMWVTVLREFQSQKWRFNATTSSWDQVLRVVQ